MLVLVSMLNLTYLRTTSYNTTTLPPVEAVEGERSKAAQKNHICVRVFQVLLQESGIALDRKRCTQQKNDKTITLRAPFHHETNHEGPVAAVVTGRHTGCHWISCSI